MSDGTGGSPERIELEKTVDVPVQGIQVPVTFGYGQDNVQHAETPSSLVPSAGEDGVRTEWDADSLESAAGWLRAHASYLRRLSYGMTDVQDLMGGDPSMPAASGQERKSPLGGFDWAKRLTGQHDTLFKNTQDGVRKLANELRDAAEALDKIKDNYHTAEKANEMSAVDMQRVFGDVAGDKR